MEALDRRCALCLWLDVPEYQGVPIEKWTTYLFHKRVIHSAWSLRSDGREHGGRGFGAGRTGLSAARMAKIQRNRYRRVPHAETDDVEVVAYDVILPWFGGSSLAEAVQGSTAASTLPHDRLALVDGSCTLLSASPYVD